MHLFPIYNDYAREKAKTLFRMHHFEGSFKNSHTPDPHSITSLVLTQSTLPPCTSFYSGEHCVVCTLIHFHFTKNRGFTGTIFLKKQNLSVLSQLINNFTKSSASHRGFARVSFHDKQPWHASMAYSAISSFSTVRSALHFISCPDRLVHLRTAPTWRTYKPHVHKLLQTEPNPNSLNIE